MKSCFWLWMRMTLAALFVAEMCLVFTVNAAGQDWPKWRGNNQDGRSLEKMVFNFEDGDGLRIAWKKTLGSGYSSVSIAGDRAFTMFSDGRFDCLVALDAETGDELWRYRIDATYRGHDNSHDGPLATPVIDGDLVFGVGRKGQLFALSIENGRRIWWKDLKSEFHALQPELGFATSPLVYGELLVLQTGGREGQSVAGLKKNTGEILWATETEVISYESPIVLRLADENQIVGVGQDNIFGLEPESGRLLWKQRHNGRGGSTYQVLVDDNKLFLSSGAHESMLIQVDREDGVYRVEELWKTRNIRQSLNLSVYHEDHIYGYSNRFLTCIDSKTGQTVWKSRPPGPGFLIFVDGHLVILTRDGTMHISEASEQRYVEKASLKVFEAFSWTPPSFANGKIYARSLQEIACIEIGKVDKLTADTKPTPETEPAKSEFVEFIKKLEAASDKNGLISQFISTQKQFPIVENDTLVHVVYHGEGQDLAIRGDMLDSSAEVPMKKVEGTKFYYYTFTLAPDARINYQIVKDLEERIPDPLNPRKVPSFRGQQSEVAMPKWVPPKHLDEPAGAERGQINSLEFESKVLGNTRTVQIYLPHGYLKDRVRYPTVYVNYGKRAVEWGKMPNTLDNFIGKSISPVIAVFVDGAPQGARREYTEDLKDNYVRMLAEELVPYIDRRYRTQTGAESRAIMGGGDGGYISIYAAFKEPGLFGLVGAQSASLRWSHGDHLRDLVKKLEKLPIRFYLDWGEYDERVSAVGDTDRVASNRAFVKLLREKGYVLSAVEANEGYGWASWRNRTDRILETFFPLKRR